MTRQTENDYLFFVASSTVAMASPYLQLFRRYLRERNLPITKQRELIADVVFASRGHLSVDDIEATLRARGHHIGKATIYRTMELLVDSGLVDAHDFGEGFKRYEHLFGHRPAHGHIVCMNCGAVVEFDDEELLRLQQTIAARYGYRAVRQRWEVYGLCPTCQAQGVPVPGPGLSCPLAEPVA